MCCDSKGEDGTPVYSRFDEKGVPTHNAQGEEINRASPVGASFCQITLLIALVMSSCFLLFSSYFVG